MEARELNTHAEVTSALDKQDTKSGFFSSPYTMHTFLVNPDRLMLFELTFLDEIVLVVQKKRNNEIRILFKKISSTFIEEIKKHFNPPYIAYNELTENPAPELGEAVQADVEVVLELDTLIHHMKSDLARKYRSAQKRNDSITFKSYQPEHKTKIFAFLDTWKETRSAEQNQFEHTANDRRFFDLYYDDPDIMGGTFWDGDKIIAYHIATRLNEIEYIGSFNKCLRGYHQLGLLSFIKRAETVFEKGAKKISVGSINNDFKKQFLFAGENVHMYSLEIYRKPDFETKSPHGYASVLLR